MQPRDVVNFLIEKIEVARVSGRFVPEAVGHFGNAPHRASARARTSSEATSMYVRSSVSAVPSRSSTRHLSILQRDRAWRLSLHAAHVNC